MFFVTSEDHQPVQMFPGVTRTLVSHGSRAMVVRIALAPGSNVPPHSHPHEQLGFVASGRVNFTIAGQVSLLQTGDGYSIPSDTPHSVEALEDAVCFDVFSPVREEYL